MMTSRTSSDRIPPFQTRCGPWAFGTGASSGIGAELARQAADKGLNTGWLTTSPGSCCRGVEKASRSASPKPIEQTVN